VSQIDPSAAPSANLPVIPDKVAAKLQDGKDVSLEELSSAAAEQRAQRESARATPLRGETLKPISRAAANTLMTGNSAGHLQRGTIPRAPATRRVIPPPFRRETISIRVPGEPVPEWRNLRADQVKEGDIVPGVGRVVSTKHATRYSEPEDVVPVTLHLAEDGAVRTVTHKPFGIAEYERLRDSYGVTGARVAVGTDIILAGPEGSTLTVDAAAQVQVFGFSS
jgi:hypothetical protein